MTARPGRLPGGEEAVEGGSREICWVSSERMAAAIDLPSMSLARGEEEEGEEAVVAIVFVWGMRRADEEGAEETSNGDARKAVDAVDWTNTSERTTMPRRTAARDGMNEVMELGPLQYTACC
mmetsp:Transcript_30424/g.61082  ORF Transcript_30424/g.61082 Transcript_30424/m.61082 type:complete len:122 (-) Transcript_30424:43-408(-)